MCIPTVDATSNRCVTCLRSIRLHTDVPHEVIVVENHHPPQGVSLPANAALRTARGEYVVFCSDDVEVTPGWWPPLKQAVDAGAKVAFPHTLNGFMRYDFAAWCFAMWRETVVEYSAEPGEFFDPAMKIWYQDTDLYRRLCRDNHAPVYVEASKILHGLSQTIEHPDHADWVKDQIQRDESEFFARWPA